MKKKRTRSVLIVMGVLLGLLVLFSAACFIKIQSETGRMTPLETQEYIKDIYSIQDTYVNMFLIRGQSHYIAIDAGNDIGHIRRELDRLDIKTEDVAAVFLTHSDRDHIAALDLFKNAIIYISESEKQMIDGRTPRFLVFRNHLEHPPELMEDGRIIKISGLEIKGILTPGHTPGAMSYLINGKYLFTGDSMSLIDGKVNTFNDFFNMDSERQRMTLKRLARFPGAAYIFTAHYGAADDYANAFSAWME